MAANIPAPLKALDLGRYATRAAQLEKFEPVISYWSKYYMVNQILSRGMHTADAQCTVYTTTLMDELEQTKQAHPDEEAIYDDVVAQAYVEKFGLDTLAKAERTMAANKVTRQTADALSASATFLEIQQVWSPLTPDMHARVKFAKFHALRIIKAIKAGEDPNASNPVTEPAVDASISVPSDEPELQAIHAPSVVPAVDPAVDDRPPVLADDPPVPQHLEQDADDSYFPPPSASAAGEPQPPVSPLEPPQARSLSPPPHPPVDAHDFYNASALPPTHQAPASTPKAVTGGLEPPFQTPVPPPRPGVPTALATPAPIGTPLQPPPAPQQHSSSGPFNTDDAAVASAQKHAKWAISALNFEDVNTAVRELREALRELGAS